ncbi:hypothetical protein D3C75_793290 [compost metagenome]
MIDNLFPKHLHFIYEKLLSIYTYARLTGLEYGINLSPHLGYLLIESKDLLIDINMKQLSNKLNGVYLNAEINEIKVGKFGVNEYTIINKIHFTNNYNQFFEQLQPYINKL